MIEMDGWEPDAAPGYGWPLGDRAWVNPSPNAANLSMARCYPGTVMLEGTTLSEGRGTTRPLELFGAPDIDPRAAGRDAGASRPSGWRLPAAASLRADFPQARRQAVQRRFHPRRRPDYDHDAFKPWRLQALGFKAIRHLYPDYELWRDFPYEYEFGKLAIDVINGTPLLREWVDDRERAADDLDNITLPDERAWDEQRRAFLRY